MATKKINITGVQAGRGPNNQTPARMEINTYLENADRRTILLLGLERMQARPQSEMKSWYQIAGIHGRPYTMWDGEGNNGQKPGGYCSHSSVCGASYRRTCLGTSLFVHRSSSCPGTGHTWLWPRWSYTRTSRLRLMRSQPAQSGTGWPPQL